MRSGAINQKEKSFIRYYSNNVSHASFLIVSVLLIAGRLTIQWDFLERLKGQLHALLTPCFPCTRCSLVSRLSLSLSLSLCLVALSLIVYSKFTWATMERETAKYGSNAAWIGPKVMGISHFLPPSSLECVFTEVPHKTLVISIHLFYFPPCDNSQTAIVDLWA